MTSALAPPSSSSVRDRLPALDVLRGIAILGTLGTNIWIFTDPEGLVGVLQSGDLAEPGHWQPVEAVLRQLANGKFLGLLTVMFGIGLAIQHRSALRRGVRWPGTYPVRAGLLFVEGLVHFLLVAEFDVLMGYAVTGVVVAVLLGRSERAQQRWMVVALVVHGLLFWALAAALVLEPLPAPRPLDPNPYADGSFLDLVAFRVDNLVAFRAEVVLILPLSVGLFLLGARLFRDGVLEPRGARLRRRLLVLGAVALPVDLVLGTTAGVAGTVLTRYATGPLVALGILALVVDLVQRRRRPAGAVGRSLAAVGRTALSAYVLQNVLAAALCYGFGLGLAARMGAARVPATVGLYVGICLVLAVAARWWLGRHDRGPLELVTHRAYGRLTRSSTSAGRTGVRAAVGGREGAMTDRSAEKDPKDWVTGGEPATGAQMSYLNTLARDAGEQPPEEPTKAEASEEIERLQEKSDRVDS